MCLMDNPALLLMEIFIECMGADEIKYNIYAIRELLVFVEVHVAYPFSFLCCCFCLSSSPVSCVSNVTSVSGMSILDCPFVLPVSLECPFLIVPSCYQCLWIVPSCYQCLWIVHS